MLSITFDLNNIDEMLAYVIEQKGSGYVLNNGHFTDEELFGKLTEKVQDEINDIHWIGDKSNPEHMKKLAKYENMQKALKTIAESMDWFIWD